MNHQNENYRDFTKNLLIYMAGEAPKMEYQPKLEKLGVEGVKEEFGKGDKPLTGEKFAGRKNAAERMIKKIELDADRKIQSQPEKELIKKLLEHNSKEFALLEHNYEVALAKLGNASKEIIKAREILNNSTHEFLKNLKVHIFKESVEQGTTEARGEMIDAFLKSKGIYMKGLGRYLVKGNWDIFGRDGSFESAMQNLKTDEEITKKLEDIIGKEKVLEGAIWAMKKDLPSFEGAPQERNYFMEQFKATKDAGKDRLTFEFGENNQHDAADTLANRFHINFTKQGKPEYIVDLTTNKVYQPDSKEWQAKLKRVCHRDLKNVDYIRSHSEGIANLRKEREAKFNELLYGTAGPDWEVHKFSRLKDNPLLTEVLRTTKGHYEQINKGLNASLNEISRLANSNDDKKTGWALDHLVRTLTPENVRSSGLLENLADLIKMIQQAVSGKDPDTLNRISKNVEGGKNPAEIQKTVEKNKLAARKNYEKLLKFKKPKIDKLLELYQNPGQSADQFFQTAAGEMVVRTKPGTDAEKGRTILNEQAKAIKYRGERKAALQNYMESHLKVSGFSVRKGKPGVTVLEFKIGDTPKTFYLEKKEDKFEISSFDEPDKKTKIENDLSALATALAVNAPAKVADKPAEQKESESEKPEKIPTNKYIDKEGVLQGITKRVRIHNVLNPKEIFKAKIKLSSARQGFDEGEVVDVIQAGKTFHFIKAGKNPARLFVNNGDKIVSVEKKGQMADKETGEETPTEAQKVAGLDIKVGGAPVEIFYNPSSKRMILKHPLMQILFDEKGERIGYVGVKNNKDVYVFDAPPNGWQSNHPKNIELDATAKKQLAAKKKELLNKKT